MGYAQLYKKDQKEIQNRPVETTIYYCAFSLLVVQWPAACIGTMADLETAPYSDHHYTAIVID